MDPISEDVLQAEIKRLARSGDLSLALNVNVHCLNLCHDDPALRRFFDSADVVFCDGVGVMLAARLLGSRIPARITYADWAWRLPPGGLTPALARRLRMMAELCERT